MVEREEVMMGLEEVMDMDKVEKAKAKEVVVTEGVEAT